MSLVIDGLSAIASERTAVHDASLSLSRGEIACVLGPNGAGKSELVLAIAGKLAKVAGSITLEGRDITTAGSAAIRAAGVAVVPEGHRVLTDLHVDDNLRAAASGLSVDPEERLAAVYGTFPELAERKKQRAGSLSGGQQQMLALGHALMAKPDYLLIDEMSLGLAPLIVKRLAGVVAELRADGVGILLIEQFTDMALSLSDQAFVMVQGRIVFSGDPKDLAADPDKLHRLYMGQT